MTHTFEAVERHEKGDKSGYHEWHYVPDHNQVTYPAQAEFAYKAGEVLASFRKKWLEDHPDDNFAKGLEMDLIPVLTDGMIMGFMVISEIDGVSYDYAPAKIVEKKE